MNYKKNHSLILCIFFFYLISSCSQTTRIDKKALVDKKAVSDTILSFAVQWHNAAKARDVNKLLHFFSSEAVVVNHGKPIITGKDSIKVWMEHMIYNSNNLLETYTGAIDIIEVSETGDLAYVRGSDWLDIVTDSGIIKDKGNWIDIWKKINGEWKCVVTSGDLSMRSSY